MTPRTGPTAAAAEAAEPAPARQDPALRDPARQDPARQDTGAGARAALGGGLFPAAPAAASPLPWARRALVVAAEVAAVILGAGVLLLRVPGLPAWDTIYAEDYSEFLIGALQHPWHLFIEYNGYEQLLPRIVAQFVTYLPLADVAKAFAGGGALVAAGCALFVFHASAGHVRSVTLRVLLAVAVILLPSAPMEIADSTVDAPWYLLLALFWAVLWRPRTRAGMAAAATVGFIAAASTSIVIVLGPLLAIRVFALRRVRDHAVTAGWLAGCLLQLPLIVESAAAGQSRLVGGQAPAVSWGDPLSDSLSFYLHDVVLRSVGWHLSWRLESLTTADWATVIVALALATALAAVVVGQPATRPFVAVALLTGFIATVGCVFLTPWEADSPVTIRHEMAARYTALPIFLIEAALIVGVDWALRGRRDPVARPGPRPGPARRRAAASPGPLLAAIALAAFLAVNWVADFRYPGLRSAPSAHQWSAVVAEWHRDCQASPTGEIRAQVKNGYWVIPCDRLRFLSPARAWLRGRPAPLVSPIYRQMLKGHQPGA
jgi:hypothetical protein